MELAEIATRFDFLKEDQLSRLGEFLQLVLEKNEVTNLTAIEDFSEGLIKHIYDCLIPMEHLCFKDKRVFDIGSGAGFPGLVFAIAEPSSEITLCESNGKKAAFMKEAIQKLDIKNAIVLNSRAEEVGMKGSFDIVSGRAVATLNIMLELSAPLLKIGGTFLSMRGREGENEDKAATNAGKKLGLAISGRFLEELPEEKGTRTITLYKKEKATPEKYPRPYAKMLSKPL